MEFR
jgi:hypothetical protein